MLVLEYDGGRFHGWQVQPNCRTVQGELRDALKVLLREEVLPVGAGRTDAGVHAEGQVASFRTTEELTEARIRAGLNGLTGDDLMIRSVTRVDEDFSARASATGRVYRYRLLDHTSALESAHAWHPRPGLETSAMRRAARAVLGRHEFDAFAASADSSERKACEVRSADWRRWEKGIEFWIAADRFLHHMVRNIVGTLIEVGTGRRKADSIPDLIRGRDRREAGPTAPACGLTLMRVDYPPGLLRP